ncbi:septum-promoting GTP-binding protein 1-like [Salvia miltiorrhiza]|uniref:septum-promoting GTP-binding protein 1-like n=1 Tax=Salvia miltiorrhiza TaxID=226208 RepID=UPI0025AC236F|nr:septum-promoting GTP-binding protein 1-like [Salvia miltiorrhiza]
MKQQQWQLCRKRTQFNIKKKLLWRISILRRYVRSVWSQFLACWSGKISGTYRPLPPNSAAATTAVSSSSSSSSSPAAAALPLRLSYGKDASDLVSLKISLFGDSNIGKTSFLTKYTGVTKRDEENTGMGINHVDKILDVKGARISYSIWDVGGDDSSHNQIPIASKDSVAMLFMFDLTSRRTLKSVITWYQEARKYNQTAVPVFIGTKFDEFIQLPIALQWTIASQARGYAKALNAPLFFSSAKYNINVNKVFKFITAKLFNLNWKLERNLTIGEPIIDF